MIDKLRIGIWAALLCSACGSPEASSAVRTLPSESAAFEVEIVGGPPHAGLDVGAGEDAEIACSTCHAPGARGSLVRVGAKPIHGPSQVVHGELACLSCHDEAQRDFLHLADGRRLPFTATIELCAQCHGPQKRDYDHGSHGGSSGYWDLSRGPRSRNHCVVCHDPHAPAYPRVLPAPGPRDHRHYEAT